jgi:hypothetical protein
MGSLNPHWLSVELDLIDATIQHWNSALIESFQATLLTMAAQDNSRAYLSELTSHLEILPLESL